jgi:hypothetical protein
VDTRIIKVGNRLGDNADMAMIDLLISTNFTWWKEVKKQKADAVEKLKADELLKSGC